MVTPQSGPLPEAPAASVQLDARRARLNRLRDLLERNGVSVGLIGRPPLIRHLTGARVTTGVLAIARDEGWLVTPEGSAGLHTPAELGVERIDTPGYDPDAYLDPAAVLAARAADELVRYMPRTPIGAELAHLPAGALGDRVGSTVDIGPLLDADRANKDAVELLAIRRAVVVVERALAAAAGAARAGATELDIHATIVGSIADDVGDDFKVASNVASGDRTAEADPHATNRVLRPGDLILLDIYPVVEGAVADLTRTWIIGGATPIQRERHAALVAALGASESIIAPGVTGADIDRVIRARLAVPVGELAGSMRHHSGHGIGVFPWERPWIGRRSTDRVDVRTVVCVEPGLYEPGVGGMRLEGQFLVRAEGVERLDRFPDDVLELPA